jgi:hypothetical protein
MYIETTKTIHNTAQLDNPLFQSLDQNMHRLMMTEYRAKLKDVTEEELCVYLPIALRRFVQLLKFVREVGVCLSEVTIFDSAFIAIKRKIWG